MLFPHFLYSPTSGFPTSENGSTILLRESSFYVYAQIDCCCCCAALSVHNGRYLLEKLYLFVVVVSWLLYVNE